VILNGAPRSGKTSVARALQAREPGVWVNLGVDASQRILPERYQPGIGLRPGGERPDLEPLVASLYAALFDSVAAHARMGLHVVLDVGLHDEYAEPLGAVPGAARRLRGLPVLLVGVHCPVEVIWERRRATWGQPVESADDVLIAAVERWQRAVHVGATYDLEVDTSRLTPEQCAESIADRLVGPPGTALWAWAGAEETMHDPPSSPS
jgi:chloramphenicol 3-O phosphotransferase